VVVAPNAESVATQIKPHTSVIQPRPQGTGDAVKAAQNELDGFVGDVIVLFGDTPLVTPEALQALREKRATTEAAVVVAGFMTDNPGNYGRLVVKEDGKLAQIVEASDATPHQKSIRLCNGGIMLFDAEKLWPLLDCVTNHNVKGEYYLTDCVEIARSKGLDCAVTEMDAENVLGVNTRIELAAAEKIIQRRLRNKAMLGGVTMTDPETVFLSLDTEIGRDVTIGPNVVIGPDVRIGDNVEIFSCCHMEGVRIEEGARIGPFAHLRPGSVIGQNAHIGNFVEIKKTNVGRAAKINHLSYIGDASVGSSANIGAGTITCNYDGYQKAHTEIGAGSFVGSNSSLVAPVTIGEGAFVGAGSVISENVEANALAVARGKQVTFSGWAKRYHDANGKKRD